MINLFHKDWPEKEFFQKRLIFTNGGGAEKKKETVIEPEEETKGPERKKEMKNIHTRLKNKASEILKNIRDITNKTSMGRTLLAKFKAYLAKKGITTTKEIPDGKGGKEIVELDLEKQDDRDRLDSRFQKKELRTKKIDDLSDINYRALRKLDQFMFHVMEGVNDRKKLITYMKAKGIDGEIQKTTGEHFEKHMNVVEGNFETVTEEGKGRRIELVRGFMSYAKSMQETKNSHEYDTAVVVTVGSGYPRDRKDKPYYGKTQFFKTWSKGDKIYKLDNLFGRIQMFDPSKVNKGMLDFQYVDIKPVDEKKGKERNEYWNLRSRLRKMNPKDRSQILANEGDLKAAGVTIDDLINNQKAERAYVSAARRNYTHFKKETAELERKGKEKIKEMVAKFRKDYKESSGGTASFKVLKDILDFFLKSLKSLITGVQFGEEDKTGKKEKKEAKEKKASKEAIEAKERPVKVSHSLEWGGFEVGKNKTRDLLRLDPVRDPKTKELADTRKIKDGKITLRGIPCNIKLDKAKLNSGVVTINTNPAPAGSDGSIKLVKDDIIEFVLENRDANGKIISTQKIKIEIKESAEANKKDAEFVEMDPQIGKIEKASTRGGPVSQKIGKLGLHRDDVDRDITVVNEKNTSCIITAKIDPTDKETVNITEVTGADLKPGDTISITIIVKKTGGKKITITKKLTIEDVPPLSDENLVFEDGTSEKALTTGDLKAGPRGMNINGTEIKRPASGTIEAKLFKDGKEIAGRIKVVVKPPAAATSPYVIKLLTGQTLPIGSYKIELNNKLGTKKSPTRVIFLDIEAAPTPSESKDLSLIEGSQKYLDEIDNRVNSAELVKLKKQRDGIKRALVPDPHPQLELSSDGTLKIKNNAQSGIDTTTWASGQKFTFVVEASNLDGSNPQMKKYILSFENKPVPLVTPSLDEDIKLKPKISFGVGAITSNTEFPDIDLGEAREGITRSVIMIEAGRENLLVEIKKVGGKDVIYLKSGELPLGEKAIIEVIATNKKGEKETKRITLTAGPEYQPKTSDCVFPSNGKRVLEVGRGNIGGTGTAKFILSGPPKGNDNVVIHEIATAGANPIFRLNGVLLPIPNNYVQVDAKGNIFYPGNNNKKLSPGDLIEVTYTVKSKKGSGTPKSRPVTLKIQIGEVGQVWDKWESKLKLKSGRKFIEKATSIIPGIETGDVDIIAINENTWDVANHGRTTRIIRDGGKFKFKAAGKTLSLDERYKEFIFFSAIQVNYLASDAFTKKYKKETGNDLEDKFIVDTEGDNFIIEISDWGAFKWSETDVTTKFPDMKGIATKERLETLVAMINGIREKEPDSVEIPDKVTDLETYTEDDLEYKFTPKAGQTYKYSIDGGSTYHKLTGGVIKISKSERDRVLEHGNTFKVLLHVSDADPKTQDKLVRLDFKVKPTFKSIQRSSDLQSLIIYHGADDIKAATKEIRYKLDHKIPGITLSINFDDTESLDEIKIFAKDSNIRAGLEADKDTHIATGSVDPNTGVLTITSFEGNFSKHFDIDIDDTVDRSTTNARKKRKIKVKFKKI